MSKEKLISEGYKAYENDEIIVFWKLISQSELPLQLT